MDTFHLFSEMRAALVRLNTRVTTQGPKFRDGSARATWLDTTVQWEFNQIEAWLTLYWHLSDNTKATISEADFTVGTAALTQFKILGTFTFAQWITNMEERDRDKLIAFFRTDSGNGALNVAQRLGQLRTLINDAKTTAMALIDTTGDATTISYETIDGLKRASGKTLADMGLNGAPLADELDLISAKVGELIRVA